MYTLKWDGNIQFQIWLWNLDVERLAVESSEAGLSSKDG